MDRYLSAAIRLHRFLVDSSWDGQALVGPDVGIRFNYRIGRFVKGYLPMLPWKDSYYYVQAQGYWILANWRLFDFTGDDAYRTVALRCGETMLRRQRPDGAWDYPNREWRGRVATAEGTWGSLGLLESYRRTGNPGFLAGASRWHRFMVETIGFQQAGEELAVNYFAHRQGARVPNNSAFVLPFLAEMAMATGDDQFLRPCQGLLAFLRAAQKPTGEFPYAVEGVRDGGGRPHFQCYQYNAFQCLDLMRYQEITGDRSPAAMIAGVLGFLRSGLAEDGRAFYDCGNRHASVTYHTAVLAAAFARAGQMGMEGYEALARRAYSHLLSRQRSDGSFPHSRGDYYLLGDRRSYPRNLAMIAYHLLHGLGRSPRPVRESQREGVAR